MKHRTMYAASTIRYTTPDGIARIRWTKGLYRTAAKSSDTAIPAYAKRERKHTPRAILESATNARFIVLDPCDPSDRWILESDGSEETARILAQCDAENIAAGWTIPRASFL